MGRTKFKHEQLARYGQVVVVPHYKLTREGVKAELEAAIGVPLHQAFESCINHSTGLVPRHFLLSKPIHSSTLAH